jgi:hypothetical protein
MPQSSRQPGGILVVTIDRLPGWMLSAFGCSWVATPALDALAGRGLCCDRLLATTSDPHATLGAFAGRGSASSPASSPAWPLFDAAAIAGWPAALVTDDPLLAATPPPAAAVRHVPAPAATVPADSAEETNLGRLFATAADTLAGGGSRLVWCHAVSLGVAWDAPLPYRERYVDPEDPPPPVGAALPAFAVDAATDPDLVMGVRQVMAGQLTLLDECLGRLVAALEGRPEGWTILVAGVRGMPLGLHGRVGTAPLLPYGELMQLPAVLVDDRGRMAAQRYGGLLVAADLGATLCELIARPPMTAESLPASDPRQGRSRDPRQGRSLAPLLDRWQGPDRDRVICTTATGTAVATPAWHLVLPADAGEPEQARLFAKPDDHFELSDVANRAPAVAEELAKLASADPQAAWTTPLSAAARNG